MIAEGKTYAKLIYDAMIYQIGKFVGSMAAAMSGRVDGIVLTGGISHDKYLVGKLTDMISFIAPVTVMAGGVAGAPFHALLKVKVPGSGS